MDIIGFLKAHFIQCSLSDLCDNNNFEKYDNFRKFIYDHYTLPHLESNNYIKYVKVKRQLLKIKEEVLYMRLINSINGISSYLFLLGVFPKIDIRKYMYKINSFIELLEFKKKCFQGTIKHVRSISDALPNKTKIFIGINALCYKYQILLKFSKKMRVLIKELIELEKNYGIDQQLIMLNNMERSFLGTKSEYIVNKVLEQYITGINIRREKQYFYETNINICKFFSTKIVIMCPMKGEIDGMIISYDGVEYIIEMLIETKSSLKATFDDITKFIQFQEFMIKLHESQTFPNKIIYKDYIFTINSFHKIMNNRLSHWAIYVCCNNYRDNTIEKSHLYFSSVIKILDDKFIEDFYIKNIDDSIQCKYKIIDANRDLINSKFKNWRDQVCFGTEFCNIFYTK